MATKKGQKWPFFYPGGSNFDPFFTIFCKLLLNMPKNIILKNQKNSFTRKIYKSEKLRKWPKLAVFWPWRVEFWPVFHYFLQITSKYAQNIILKNQKKHSLEKFISPKNCENGQKRAKNGRFVALEGRILTLFSQIFANHF